MAAGVGLLLAGFIYLITITILIKTRGFRRTIGQPDSFLHFRNQAISLELGIIGLFNFIIGIVWLALWTYFLLTRWPSFQNSFNFLLPHVLIQLVTAIALLVSGLATIRESKNWKQIYLTSLAFLIISTLVAIVFYDPYGHSEVFAMRFLEIWSFFIAGIMTLGFFFLHRLLSPPRHSKEI